MTTTASFTYNNKFYSRDFYFSDRLISVMTLKSVASNDAHLWIFTRLTSSLYIDSRFGSVIISN